MNLDRVDAGRDVPNDVNVVIEIPMNGDPIKYELDKATGALFIDRFMSTSIHYPCNYGYIPHTLSSDGDPVDALVAGSVPKRRKPPFSRARAVLLQPSRSRQRVNPAR